MFISSKVAVRQSIIRMRPIYTISRLTIKVDFLGLREVGSVLNSGAEYYCIQLRYSRSVNILYKVQAATVRTSGYFEIIPSMKIFNVSRDAVTSI